MTTRGEQQHCHGLTRRCSEPLDSVMTSLQHVYEIRPRKDRRGVDLISDSLPFGRLWYGEPDAIRLHRYSEMIAKLLPI